MKKITPVFLLVHGLGAQAERWIYLVNFFKKHNIHCIAPNFPVQGPLSSWDKAIDNQLKILQKKANCRIYLVGESLGGLVIYNKLLKHDTNLRLAGCILISPAFKSIMRFSFLKYLTILLGLLCPWIKTKAPFSAGMCTRDGKYQNKMQFNKHETRNFNSKLYLDIVFQQIYALWRKPPKHCPLLFLLAGADTMVSTATAKKIYQRTKNFKQNKLITYPKAAHALSIDICRQKVFTDILHWTRGLK